MSIKPKFWSKELIKSWIKLSTNLVSDKIYIPGRHPKTKAKLEILMGSSILYKSPSTPLEFSRVNKKG